MKTLTCLLLPLFVITLVGCSAIPPKYDNNEYEFLVRLETTASLIRENCDAPNRVNQYIPLLEYDARLLYTYSRYTPNNPEMSNISSVLKSDALEIKKQYSTNKATTTYCMLKTKLFLKKTQTALKTVASKMR